MILCVIEMQRHSYLSRNIPLSIGDVVSDTNNSNLLTIMYINITDGTAKLLDSNSCILELPVHDLLLHIVPDHHVCFLLPSSQFGTGIARSNSLLGSDIQITPLSLATGFMKPEMVCI
jgi:hypothetical protein